MVIFIVNKNVLKFELKEHEYNSIKNIYKLESRYFNNMLDDAKRNINNISKEQVFMEYIETSKNRELAEKIFYNYTLSKEEILQLRYLDIEGNEKI